MKLVLIQSFALTLLICGCAVLKPQSPGEVASGFTYVPIDPFPVTNTNDATICLTGTNLLQALPDNSVRLSVEQISTSGNVSYGPAGVSVKGEKYKVTVDYINADTANIVIGIARHVQVYTNLGFLSRPQRVSIRVGLNEIPPYYIRNSDSYEVVRLHGNIPNETGDALSSSVYNIPIYIGIGLRVTADIIIAEGNVNISGLGPIAAAAAANQLRGSLVVPTLGVNGKSVAAALPIQSELNQTTAQNAVVAVGAVKALLYEPDTTVVPRVVGMYIPFRGEKSLVNAIISALSREPIHWKPIICSDHSETNQLTTIRQPSTTVGPEKSPRPTK